MSSRGSQNFRYGNENYRHRGYRKRRRSNDNGNLALLFWAVLPVVLIVFADDNNLAAIKTFFNTKVLPIFEFFYKIITVIYNLYITITSNYVYISAAIFLYYSLNRYLISPITFVVTCYRTCRHIVQIYYMIKGLILFL